MMNNCEQDICELAHSLKQQKLFIDAEKLQIQTLNEKVVLAVEDVFQSSWVRAEQTRNYQELLSPDSSPASCCQNVNLLNSLKFIPSYKVLGSNDALYGALVTGLRDQPALLARLLVVGDSHCPHLIKQLVHTIFSSVYASCLLPHDHNNVLLLLKELMEQQVCVSQNPLRLLRNSCCAFSLLYRAYVDALPQAKVFLTAALHQPLLQLLVEDDLFLDIDASKAALRFPPQVRLRKFGEEGTPSYDAAVAKYKTFVMNRLAEVTNRFMSQLSSSMQCFPPTLLWLVRSLFHLMMRSTPSSNVAASSPDPEEGCSAAISPQSAAENMARGAEGGDSPHRLRQTEVTACCIDLVVVQLLCPALITPEMHGVCDAPVSHIARFNLTQVAELMQMLALSRCDTAADSRLTGLHEFLNASEMQEIVSNILEGPCRDVPFLSESSNNSNNLAQSMVREVCLLPHSHLNQLLTFLHAVKEHLTSEQDKATLQALLGSLQAPPQAPSPSRTTSSTTSAASTTTTTGSSTSGATSRKSLINRVKNSRNKMSRGASTEVPPEPAEQPTVNGGERVSPNIGAASSNSGAVTPVSGNNITSFISAISGGGGAGRVSPGNTEVEGEDGGGGESALSYDTVLVLPIDGGNESSVLPGMTSEEKVLSSLQQYNPEGGEAEGGGDSGGGGGRGEGGPSEMIVEKRTRFSLSHDDGSIGNTSDNLEAVSEAASNHSVASSLDDVEQEDQPDNLSDMMSANVSGRGTPNVSGRDTPSSQVTEGDEAGALRGPAGGEEEEPRHRSPVQNIAVVVPKPVRDDIEEKFGKFEIKPLVGGDETFSLVSDTWSTDVLASDSETIEMMDREERQDLHDQLLNRHLQELDRMQGAAGHYHNIVAEEPAETFETASEAWSTDVLTSDSERLQEFDTDDSQSVARSDDAGRSEVEGESAEAAGAVAEAFLIRPEFVPPNTPDNITPRVQQARSPAEMLAAAPSKGEPFSPPVLKPTPVLPASRSLDSGSAAPSTAAGTLKPHPQPVNGSLVLQGQEEWPLPPSSAPPTIGFRPINPPPGTEKQNQASDVPRNGTCPDATINDTLPTLDNILPVTTASNINGNHAVNNHVSLSLHTANGYADILVDSMQTLSLDGTKTYNGDSNIKDGSLSANKKLVQGGSADDSSLHLSTTSLASSSSSSSEMNGRGGQEEAGASNGSLVNGVKEAHCTMSAATGAIPKSISFDKSAEQGGDRDAMEGPDARNKKGFFRNFRLGVFKQRRKGGTNRDEGGSMNRNGAMRRSEELCPTITETSDDILAKYRTKKLDTTDGCSAEDDIESKASVDTRAGVEEEDERLIIDPNNIASSYAFDDAKRKLRLVLSASHQCEVGGASGLGVAAARVELKHTRNNSNSTVVNCNDRHSTSSGPLSLWLSWQIAAARSLHDRQLLARLTEAYRCLQLFDEHGQDQLIAALKEDHQRRAPYIAYLVRSRQGLLTTLDYLEGLKRRVSTDTSVISSSLVSKCVQMFLDRPEVQLREFTRNFTSLNAPDEKVQLVSNFLDHLSHQMRAHSLWRNVSEEQLAQAEAALEQSVMAHIYDYALYPNGDVDINRDQVLYDHISKLSLIITPNHKALRIPKMYQYECPWPSAQIELGLLAAYKTAVDKLHCVVRAATTILNLLSLAHTKSIPAADDFMPVFVYVLIKANPPHLLSTLQYVNVYYEERMEGEQRYWWTQLCSAVEFIKTMDYDTQ